ncbi:uncharacterized protein LOC122506043 isoform X2 [Leptopilina heterotoma]|uniref:uncharacterized protein LOC122506043 isoform X2 n=1 Tax=Leptopilina heterotoma TaxID=63436 RepID=UPI001CAA3272|nr:uncharacterized protein LOC122506043 isoform X2 [Leptopilina heterotoma]
MVYSRFHWSIVYILEMSYIFMLITVIYKCNAIIPSKIENEVVIIDHLSGHRVHLSNFFWTGVNDAPSWIMLKQLLLFFENKGVNNFLPTNTLDESKNGFNESLFNPNIPFCKACVNFNSTISEGEENIGVLIGDDPGPRYWLITILKSEKGVPPKIELRLARLYHLAFRRQQQLHLGLYGSESQQILYNKTLAFNQIQEGKPSSDYVTVSVNENKENHVVNKRKTVKMKQKSSLNLMRTIRLRRKEMYPLFIQRETSSEKSMAENITESVENEFNISQSKSGLYNLLSSVGFDIPDNNREDITSFELSTPFSSINSENSPLGNSNKLKVEESLLKVTAHGDPENVNLVQVRMQDVAVMDNSNLRLIYSVHLGGKPVPAEIAAKDMSLLSSQEVALELGTPVLVQSTPYLNTTAPLALSRKRDVFILTGAAGISILLFIIIIIILIPVLKKKGSKPVASSVNQNNIKENREYIPKRLDHDYVMCTSETERDTIATSQSYSPNSRYVNMITPNNSDSLEDSSNDNTTENVICSKNNLLSKHNTPVYQNKNTSVIEKHRYEDKGMTTDTDPDRPKTYAKSNISVTDDVQKSVDKKDATSPCSYLSMKSCKKFPTVKSVEPLSKVLESMATKEVDIELDSLDQQATKVPGSEIVRKFWSKFYSSRDDPGAIGPIVWNLKSNNCKEIGQARQRLHELLEDSWTNAGKETEIKNFVSYQHHPASEEAVTNATHLSQLPTNFLRLRDSSSHMVSTSQPNANVKSTKLDESVQDTSRVEQHCSGTWGTRPLSAGPFHRPNLSDISKMCVSTNSNLPSEDPAVTIIDAIKQELTKFAK